MPSYSGASCMFEFWRGPQGTWEVVLDDLVPADEFQTTWCAPGKTASHS